MPRMHLLVSLVLLGAPVTLRAQAADESLFYSPNRILQQPVSPTYLSRNPFLGQPLSPYNSRVNPYSPYGAANPYSTGGGRIYAQDGTYLGRLNANQYDPESVANPYGRYGSPYSPNSINNSYGQYGSPYSRLSPNDSYTTTPPVVIYDDPY